MVHGSALNLVKIRAVKSNTEKREKSPDRRMEGEKIANPSFQSSVQIVT